MAASKDHTRAVKVARDVAGACVGARVRTLNRAVTRIYDDQLRPHGIRFSQMNIMTLVMLEGPVNATRVGRALDIEKSTLSRNLKILEDNGWVRSDAGHGNARELTLTAAGRRLLIDVQPAWQQAQDEVINLLGERATKAIRQSFERARAASTAV